MSTFGANINRFAFDIDEPEELGGGNAFANPQEHLLAALNACMTVGYVAQCSVRGIKLESLSIETEGDIDLRGFLGIDPAVASSVVGTATTAVVGFFTFLGLAAWILL